MPVVKSVVKLAKAAVAAPPAAPAPKAKLAVAKATVAPPRAAPAPKGEAVPRTSRIAGELEGKKIVSLVAENPKREGTNAAAMWELYKKGLTYTQLREAGVSVADIHWNIKHEFVTFG